MPNHTITSLKALKHQRPITMITAYDALFARLFASHIDVILVGDSLNMSFLGAKDTLSATLEQMIYHTQAVCNGAPEAFVVCDMPFGSYNTPDEALRNAMKVYQTTPAAAVKIEGGATKAATVRHLVDNGIAVVGHVGLMPQMVRADGGYSVKGKDEASMQTILEDARAIEAAGAFMLVIEGVKTHVATAVAKALSIPVIGIGAGVDVDGQVLVWSDMLGLFEAFTPKFVKTYMEGATQVRQAVKRYADEVQARTFPTPKESY
ncbi:MAG: 3-methyl-2-oxobutanoate hydroxymethyltransferase [Sulfuricurvum sp. PC08-66]|nr:MAG: 3-methyl-2-oxobutanoate hydroxymethyltransferase [Sulfuricurvum sp. PC08-66]